MVGADDLKFSGLDLANLIREKYGRSYDVQLIRKVVNIHFTFLTFSEAGNLCKPGKRILNSKLSIF